MSAADAMPHVSNDSGGDDLCSSDEVKVFKEEGEEKRSSENLNELTEEQHDLIDLSESEEKSENAQSYSTNKHGSRSDLSSAFVKTEPTVPHTSAFNMGYLVSPYPYSNGTTPTLPVSMASKMGLAPPTHPATALPFFCHNGEHLTQPPPAHMGYNPYQLDPKGSGLPRPPLYPFTAGQYPYPMLSPEMTQVAASWHSSGVYPISSSSSPGFRSPYPSSTLPSDFYRFSPTGILAGHPPGLSPHSHPAIVTPGPKQELIHSEANHRSSLEQKSSSNDGSKLRDSCHNSNSQDKKKSHIKKPLNAFMLYMKEMRAKVVAECTLKESAAINQILGRRWHALGRDEQAKYYELARRERQLHMQLYPDWSSRANTTRTKKRKKKQETHDGGNNMKKCRARYGLDQQSQWCKPCRRKKRCVRYVESGDSGNQSEDNLGSSGSAGDARSVDDDGDDGESLQHSASSPGGFSASGLSNLTSPPSLLLHSPSASLASPAVSLASPCVSLQSPLTPHPHEYDSPTSKPPPPPPPLPPPPTPLSSLASMQQQHHHHHHHHHHQHQLQQQHQLQHPNSSSSSVAATATATAAGPGSVSSSASSASSSSSSSVAAAVAAAPSLSLPPPPPPPPPLPSHPASSSNPSCLPLPLQFFSPVQPPRHPVGTNPHDINNPLSINQLTGKCIKSSSSGSSIGSSSGSNSANKDSRSAIQVT